jgi:branched-chain amino acid aminotransferase
MSNQHNFLPTAFFQSQFLPFADAKISIATHAFQYGTGAFGGMRGSLNPSYPNEVLLFRINNHAKRLSNSAKFFDYDIKPEYIATKIIEFVKINKPTTDFYIRPMIYISDLGISPMVHGIAKDFLLYGLELGDYLNPKGISCRFSSWTRQQDSSVPLRGKITGSYTMSSMAKSEAIQSGFDEALIFNSQGKVCEASAMNFFLIKNGKLITPGVEQDILEGITRDSVLQIAKDLGIETIERQVDKTEILLADELFFTGTAGKVTPVYKVENYNLPESRPITDKIRDQFNSIIKGENPQYEGWITRVGI